MPASRLRSRLRSGKAILTTAALSGATLAGLTVAAAPAHAWGSANVDFAGHGYGHGRGMGQYGAYGYAVDYGWNYTQILNHYYGGTAVKTVGLAPMTVDLSALDGSGSVIVSSSAAFTAGGLSVAAHGAAKISYVSAGKYTVQLNSTGCGRPVGGAHSVTSGLARSSVASPSSAGQLLTVCETGRGYRGTLSLTYGGGATRLVNALSMDDYLRGVVPRESPASWGDSGGGKGMAALQAQAVAARSYAAVSNRYSWARICDSQNCQVYSGAALDGDLIEDSRTNTAVGSTSTKVLVSDASGSVVSAEYSSSTGGWTAGGQYPAVQDLGDKESPNHDWTASIPAGTVGDTFGVGTLSSLTMARNGLGADGGRVTSVTVKGSSGSTTVSGEDFAYELGLKSDWFTVHDPVIPTLYYANSLGGSPKIGGAQAFGQPGDVPLACDWNGDNKDTGAVYRSRVGTFYLRDSTAAGAPLRTVALGTSGDLPVCGDWNGDHVDTPGVYDPRTSMFYLINTNSRTASTPLIRVLLGGKGYLPIAGDWEGTGRDTPGVYNPVTSRFYLADSLRPGANRITLRFGQPGNVPVAGDWNGDGVDSPGVFQDGRRFATASDLQVMKPVTYTFFGLPGDRPFTGDWNGDKKSTVGVGRGY